MKSIKIIPTIVPDSLASVGEVSNQYSSFASFFQIDVADGKFAPNTTWLPAKGDSLPEGFSYEVHCMVANPHAVGLSFANAGTETIIGHIEAFGDVENAALAFAEWKTAGARSVGLAILLQTPLKELEPFLPLVDFVLFMTIASIGVQGIPFESEGIARIVEFRKKHPDVVIAVDGGVALGNIAELARAGATRFGVGSAISKADNPMTAYEALKKTAEEKLDTMADNEVGTNT